MHGEERNSRQNLKGGMGGRRKRRKKTHLNGQLPPNVLFQLVSARSWRWKLAYLSEVNEAEESIEGK